MYGDYTIMWICDELAQISSSSNFTADEDNNRLLTLRYMRASFVVIKAAIKSATRKPIVSSAKGNESEETRRRVRRKGNVVMKSYILKARSWLVRMYPKRLDFQISGLSLRCSY